MTDRLDDILSSDDRVTPTGDFVVTVMQAVHAEAALDCAIPFPWWRLGAGIAAMILLTVLIAALPASSASVSPDAFWTVVRFTDTTLVSTGLIWIAIGAILSSVAVRLSLRMA